VGFLARLFAKGPANSEKAMLGCLVANLFLVAIMALILWLLGAEFVLFGKGQ